MNKGLYFYKLVSPYPEDVTKDCKLTINEIDSNFITLKDADIKDFSFDSESNIMTLTRNNGETLTTDLTSLAEGVVHNLNVCYDEHEGKIVISYDDKKVVIDGLITKCNIGKNVLTHVDTDSSIIGKGIVNCPIGISPVEKTGQYRPCIKFLDLTKGEVLPRPEDTKIGTRFLTYEKVSDYGFLYNYKGVQAIAHDLEHGWRIPSKADWDDMLNTIEPCDEFRTHDSSLCNRVLGKFAGKLLKSRHHWHEEIFKDECPKYDEKGDGCDCHHEHGKCHQDGGEDFEPDFHDLHELKKKPISPKGVDKFGMRILAAGYGDGCEVYDYFGKRTGFWTSTMIDNTDVYVKRFDFNQSGVAQTAEDPHALFSLRLVKDYNGSNFHEFEFINGHVYKCVLMPSATAEHGFTIWTANNAAFEAHKYNPKRIPCNIASDTYKTYFFTAEWNGFTWMKKRFNEGDSVVLFRGLKGEPYDEYRLIDGHLVSTTEKLHDEIMEEIDKEIKRLDEKIETESDRAQKVEAELWESLNEEISARTEVDAQMWDALAQEASARTEVDNQQWDAINAEAQRAKDVEKQLWEALDNERVAREEVDNQQWTAINNEISARTEVDNQQWDAINQCFKNLEQETKDRIEIDNQQWERINYNTDHLVMDGKYDSVTGELLLETKNPENNFTIQFNGNYGTF